MCLPETLQFFLQPYKPLTSSDKCKHEAHVQTNAKISFAESLLALQRSSTFHITVLFRCQNTIRLEVVLHCFARTPEGPAPWTGTLRSHWDCFRSRGNLPKRSLWEFQNGDSRSKLPSVVGSRVYKSSITGTTACGSRSPSWDGDLGEATLASPARDMGGEADRARFRGEWRSGL